MRWAKDFVNPEERGVLTVNKQVLAELNGAVEHRIKRDPTARFNIELGSGPEFVSALTNPRLRSSARNSRTKEDILETVHAFHRQLNISIELSLAEPENVAVLDRELE